jgi:hypothetical protein
VKEVEKDQMLSTANLAQIKVILKLSKDVFAIHFGLAMTDQFIWALATQCDMAVMDLASMIENIELPMLSLRI